MSRASEFLNEGRLTPGNSRNLKLGDGEWSIVIFDPDLVVTKTKFGSVAIVVQELTQYYDDNGKKTGLSPIWKTRTMFLSFDDLAALLEVCNESRQILNVNCGFIYKFDKDENPILNDKKQQVYDRQVTWKIHAPISAASAELEVPERRLPKAPETKGKGKGPEPLA